MTEEGRVHPDCRNASNPYHECSDYCFRIIAETKAQMDKNDQDGHSGGFGPLEGDMLSRLASHGVIQAIGGNVQPSSVAVPNQAEDVHDEIDDLEDHPHGDSDNLVEENLEVDFTKLTGRQKKLFELRLKMNEARKANQTAMVTEKKRMEAPPESRGVSKEKWIEERKKKIGKLLDANGLDMTKAYMLDTEEMAETKYKKWEKEPAPFGWDVFNQKSLYNAYKKRTKNIDVDIEEYNKMKEADPEFYREASSLQYGKAPKVSDDKVERMVKELKDRDEKRKSFSRRRRFHDEKDIDSINDRNEHFNKKIERAFGKYTLEIKNNLERGTALPD
ncbi:hypothetical protein ACSBR2_003603 [Camellia fascicularis]|uniref:Pre-mRNA-splicing factor syf2 n=1 Tax=Camellia lanceoleosa TaxID=1840588 RepID=A0ACC0IHJ7_9ERIC|nr:Pre-mRNA-splicing factor syf2 [Camellia lanceoleosa]